MATVYSKGWFVLELKKAGVRKHPVDQRKLELHKEYVLRNLYFKLQEKSN